MHGHEYAFNSQRSIVSLHKDRLFLSRFLFDHLASIFLCCQHYIESFPSFLQSVCLRNALWFWRHLAPSSGTHVRSARRCHPSRQRWRWGASFAEASHVLPMLFLAHSNPTCARMSAVDSSPSGHSTHSHSPKWDLGFRTECLALVIQVCPACVAASSKQVKGAVPSGLWDWCAYGTESRPRLRSMLLPAFALSFVL